MKCERSKKFKRNGFEDDKKWESNKDTYDGAFHDFNRFMARSIIFCIFDFLL